MSDVERYIIPMSYDRPPLHANQRLHRMQEARIISEVRNEIAWRARSKKMKDLGRIRVQLVWRPEVNRVRDAANIWPTQKAAIDGLRDAGVIPDDDGRYVEEHAPRLLPVGAGESGVWLVVEVIE